MDSILTLLLEHGSYFLMLAALIAAGLGVPLPEDIVLIAGGALIHRGVTDLTLTAVTCAGGVLAGDLIIFMAGRLWGPAAFNHPWFARLLPERRKERLEGLFERYGGRMVFAARHVAGLRAPMFALAGLHRMSIPAFLVWDALALCISGPFFMFLGWFFSERLNWLLGEVADFKLVVAAVAGGLLLLALAQWAVRRWWRARRKRAGKALAEEA